MARMEAAVPGPARPLGISPVREVSGTSWLQDTSPMYMLESNVGAWSLDLMGNVFVQWIDERGPRDAPGAAPRPAGAGPALVAPGRL
jgi:hypothetical protein